MAGAQLVHPLWGAAAGLLLPVALRRRLSAENAEDLTGVYVSILFVPALTAAAIVSVDAGVRSELLSLLNIHFAMPGLLSLAPALLSCGMLVISLVLRPWNASASVIVALGFALMAVCVVFSSMALQVEPVAAAFGILALGLVCSWPVSGARRPLALLPVFGIAVCMWTPFWLGHAHV